MKSIISVISCIKNKLVNKDNHNKTVDNLKDAFKDSKKKSRTKKSLHFSKRK